MLNNLSIKLQTLLKNLINHLKKPEILFTIFTIALISAVHFINMFNTPYYENDEGIYQSQAWSISSLGSLSPYTYWYDHAPMGWIILNFFTRLIGGFYQVNFSGFESLDTGRFIILIFKIITAIYLYLTVKNLTKNKYVGGICILLYGLSPLAVFFQRRILLDNIMLMTIIISLYLITLKSSKLANIMLSGLLFGISCLVKESAVFLFPGFLVYILLNVDSNRKYICASLWTLFSVFTILLYPILAILKSELFPKDNQVSLVGTLLYQTGRGKKIPFWESNSELLYNVSLWNNADKYYVYAALGVVITSVIFGILTKNKTLLSILAILLGITLFMIRGGIILDFYILPFFALVGILGAMNVDIFIEKFPKSKSVVLISTFVIILFSSWISFQSKVGNSITSGNDNFNTFQSLKYIRKNIDPKAKFIIDHALWLDLRKDTNKSYNNAHYFYKLDTDPAVGKKVFDNNWKNIEYVVGSHQIYKTITDNPAPILKEAMDNSFMLADYRPNNEFTTDHSHSYWSVNGNWSAVFKTNNNANFLTKLNQSYFNKYVSNSGQTIDDQTKFTTSEGQAYTMLRSLITGNKSQFDQTWKWTKDILRTRTGDKLSSWKYGAYQNETKVLDKEAATDADLDIAYSLIKACQIWNDGSYIEEAKEIVNDIYKLRVKEYNQKLFLLPFSSTAKNGFEILNPSYFSPSYYREFAKINPDNNWIKLVDDTYSVLSTINQSRKLYPDWIKYNIKEDTFSSASDYLQNPLSDNFSFDAMRVLWRIGEDYTRNQDSRAKIIMENASEFFESKMDKGLLVSSWTPTGDQALNYETGAMNAMVSIPLNITNSKYSNRVWKDRVLMNTNYNLGIYQKNENYYDQNLIWLSYHMNYLKNGFSKI